MVQLSTIFSSYLDRNGKIVINTSTGHVQLLDNKKCDDYDGPFHLSQKKP